MNAHGVPADDLRGTRHPRARRRRRQREGAGRHPEPLPAARRMRPASVSCWSSTRRRTSRPELLEQVRLLTNLETETQKLLQIILIGQPELRELLVAQRPAPARAAHHRALSPRAAVADASPSAYVKHRLRIAGRDHGHLHPGRAARAVPRQRRRAAPAQHHRRPRAARWLFGGPAPGLRVDGAQGGERGVRPARSSRRGCRGCSARPPRWSSPARCMPAGRCCCASSPPRCRAMCRRLQSSRPR